MRDTPLDIRVHAYAQDEPERVSVMRDTRFVFPKTEEIGKALKNRK